MFPFCFEWQWDLGHLIFFGLFYAALVVIGFNIQQALFLSWADLNFSEQPEEYSDDDESGGHH